MKRIALIMLIVFGITMPFMAQTTYTALSGTFSSSTSLSYLIKPTGATKVEFTITILANSIPSSAGAALNFYNGESAIPANLFYNLPSMAVGSYNFTSTATSVLIVQSNSTLVPFTITYKAVTNQWLLSGNDVVFNNGNVGIGSLAPTFPFTVEKARGNTNAKFGIYNPVYIWNTAPTIGFNTYYENSYKFGKTDASASYGGALSYFTGIGTFYFMSSSTTGTEGSTPTMNTLMTLTNQGKIGLGIGMTNPISKLSIKQTSGSYTEGIHLNYSTLANWYIYSNANNNLTIGGISPEYGMTLNNASGAMTFSLGDYWTTGKTSLAFKTTAVTGGDASIQAVKVKGSSMGNLLLNPEGGSVGIGTPTPVSKLDINHTAMEGAQTTFARTAANAALALSASSKTDTKILAGIGSSTYAWIQVQNINNTLYNLVLNPIGGNVGIGTATPTQKLTIESSGDNINSVAGFYNPVPIANAQGKGAAINLGYNAENYYAKIAAVFENNSPSYLNPALVFYTMNETNAPESEVERMRISSNGNVLIKENVGIGTTNPQSKLDINGDININSGIDDNHIFWGGHYMTLGTKPGEYAHNSFSLKPGGSTTAKLYSEFNMYVANSPSSHELKVKIHTDGVSYFNGGNVLIGKNTQTNSLYKLDVAGKIRANEVIINTTGSDFVFASDYKLRSLSEVENYIKQNQHLPEIAPAKEMQDNGVGVSELQTKLLQKVEELTLYMIEQAKNNQELQKQFQSLKLENEELKKEMNDLKK